MRRVRSAAILALELLGLLALAGLLTLRVPPVLGTSMEPQVHAGEIVVIWTLAYRWRAMRRGDLVAFSRADDPQGQVYLKRIVALPGERVEIVRGNVRIDGRVLDEPYVAHRDDRSSAALTVPAGDVYVLGDDRPASDDSRDWGPIPENKISGRAFAATNPPRWLR